jgi:dihydroorotase
MTGLETMFAVYNSFLEAEISIPQLVQKISIAPRKMLGIAIPAIKVGETADLTLFDPGADWTYSLQNLQSKSKNSPFLNKTLKGRVLGIVNGNQWVQNN